MCKKRYLFADFVLKGKLYLVYEHKRNGIQIQRSLLIFEFGKKMLIQKGSVLQCTLQVTDTVLGYIEPGTLELPKGYNAAAACKNSAL